jgi:hypothetical protein
MTDLYVAALVLTLVSAGAFALGVVAGRRLPRVAGTGLAGLALVAAVWFIAKFWGDVRIIRWLPFTGVPVLANLQVPMMALMAGLVWSITQAAVWRKSLLTVALALAAGWSAYRPYSGPEPPVHPFPIWAPGAVLMQTSDATCSPAAAVTLLSLADVETTEAEMARLCLTTARGTSTYGLYRGLRIKLRGTGYDVVPFVGTPADLGATGDPAIVTVGLRAGQRVDPRYVMQYGWTPGLQHTVAVFRVLPDGRVNVGDPSAGRETWSHEDLRVLWHGQGFRLTKIDSSSDREIE